MPEVAQIPDPVVTQGAVEGLRFGVSEYPKNLHAVDPPLLPGGGTSGQMARECKDLAMVLRGVFVGRIE
ncbi:hypothetical protein GCM10009837_72110 [Streptomyces durmitorensis]